MHAERALFTLKDLPPTDIRCAPRHRQPQQHFWTPVAMLTDACPQYYSSLPAAASAVWIVLNGKSSDSGVSSKGMAP